MDNFKALDALRDIHLPEAISWWPLAAGWYLVGVLISILLCFATWRFYKLYSAFLPKKEALRLLQSYQEQYNEANFDPVLVSTSISLLLKRVALAYYPRIEVAKLEGNEWLKFLNSSSKNLDFFRVSEFLLIMPYQDSSNLDQKSFNLNPLFDLSRKWIQQRGKPCLV